MRPALDKTIILKGKTLTDQTTRALHTATWMRRNVADKWKPDAQTILEHLKDAADISQRMLDEIAASQKDAVTPPAEAIREDQLKYALNILQEFLNVSQAAGKK